MDDPLPTEAVGDAGGDDGALTTTGAAAAVPEGTTTRHPEGDSFVRPLPR